VVRARFGRVDILVHSAGDFTQGSISDTDADAIRALLETNAVAPYATTRALMPLLIASCGQVAIMNSSVVGARRGGIAGYAASKAALSAFADTLREEVNACGVRVLNVFIGRTATPMQERIHAIEGRAYDPNALLQPDDVAAMVIAALALPATAEVTEFHIRPMRKPSTDGLPVSTELVVRAD
jgi:NADP-dependent 3-hydroxy acid dehydrogenase YdfG